MGNTRKLNREEFLKKASRDLEMKKRARDGVRRAAIPQWEINAAVNGYYADSITKTMRYNRHHRK